MSYERVQNAPREDIIEPQDTIESTSAPRSPIVNSRSFEECPNSLSLRVAPSSVKSPTIDDEPSFPLDWHKGPHTLRLGRSESLVSWTWDILLTLTPGCFFALIVAALRLDKQPISPYGEKIVNLTLLSPSIYPIVFAAVASRFFKNFARWRLERRRGIDLGTLEQIFGSQSLAGAIERLLFVRSRIPIGIITILIWGLSPLGGQGAARLLVRGGSSQNGTVFYTNPVSQNQTIHSSTESRGSVTALYSTSFLSSATMRQNILDFWDWPRIPQWLGTIDNNGTDNNGTRAIDIHSLAADDYSYASLLGVQIQGLDMFSGDAQYYLSIETFYHDFACRIFTDTSKHIPKSWDNLTSLFTPGGGEMSSPFAALISYPNLTDIYPNIERDPVQLDDLPPAHMAFAVLGGEDSRTDDISIGRIFNCSIRPVGIETDIVCNSSISSTTCWPTHQRKMNKPYDSHDNVYTALMTTLSQEDHIQRPWRAAQGLENPALTIGHLRGELNGELGTAIIPNPTSYMEGFSKRMTTAFNTFIDAVSFSGDHAYAAFRAQPSIDSTLLPPGSSRSVMDSTEALVTTQDDSYRVNRLWMAALITTTEVLIILAVLGLLLQMVICGPDILGFASSLTRENVYMNIPVGGSTLDGPARARALRSLRVQLVDIRPNSDTGYIEFAPAYDSQQADGEEDISWRGLSRWRNYQ